MKYLKSLLHCTFNIVSMRVQLVNPFQYHLHDTELDLENSLKLLILSNYRLLFNDDSEDFGDDVYFG